MIVLLLSGCTCRPGILPLFSVDDSEAFPLDGAVLTINCESP